MCKNLLGFVLHPYLRVVTYSDFIGLKKLKDACGKQFVADVVFHAGENVLPFCEKLFAVPISLLTPSVTELADWD